MSRSTRFTQFARRLARLGRRGEACRPVALALSLALALALLPACARSAAHREEQPRQLEPTQFGGLTTCYQWGDLYLSSVPGEEELELAVRRGILTLIDLREAGGAEYELIARARDLGLSYVHTPIDPEVLADEQVDLALSALKSAEGHPALVFCDTGSRAAMLAALYRISLNPQSLEPAILDARRAGMKPGTSEAALRRQAARLTAAASAVPATWSGSQSVL
jgi:uncharacterized protein (TIGR01244 family)